MCFLCSGLRGAPTCITPDVPTIAPASSEQLPGGNATSNATTMNGIETTDHAGSIATTAVLTLGVSEYGTISSTSDSDWFRVNLVAGETYEFRLLRVGNAPLTDPLVRVRDSAGTILDFNDDAGATTFGGVHGQSSRLIFTATTTGTFYVEADAFSTETGGYLLTGVTQTPGGMVYTIDEIAQQLTNAGENFFGSAEAAAFNVGGDGQLTVNVTALTAQGQTLALAALQTWSDLTGIQFVQTAGAAEITFDDSDPGTTAYANTVISGTTITSSTVMLTTGWLTEFGTSFDSYSYETYIHEIGHALGLAHGGNYNGSATFGIDNYYLNDSVAYSIMSYMNAIGDEFPDANTFVNADFRYMLTPVLADFVAIDRLYGSSTNTRTGNTTYGYNSNTGNAQLDAAVTFGADINFMVHDNGGTDTLNFSGSSAFQTLNLNADSFSNVLGGVFNLSISRETVIENAIGGSGGNVIYGNNAVNGLTGGSGVDSLYGGNGGDNLWGGAGSDTHNGGNDAGVDYARYDDANYGNLMIRLDGLANTGAAAAGDTYIGIEGLVGGAGNDTVVGNGSNNFLFGSGGVDLVYGGAGNDFLSGDAGGDNLWGGTGADQHIGGTDAGVDYARYDDANHGNLMIRLDGLANTGAAAVGDTYSGIEGLVGGAGNDTVVGNGSNNFLFGSGGGDLVYGGAGNDYLSGDAGGDNLWGGTGADQHIGGTDAGIDYARYDDANHGNLTISLLTPSSNTGAAAGDTYSGIEGLVGGAGNDVIVGNSLANFLFGSGGNDFIDGREGNDYLNGGAGADDFRFATALGATNVDTIADFAAGVDDILLAQAIFSAIGVTLDATEFRIGMALDNNDFLLYNPGTGQLFYDTNANGAGGMIQFANVTINTALTVGDFVMV